MAQRSAPSCPGQIAPYMVNRSYGLIVRSLHGSLAMIMSLYLMDGQFLVKLQARIRVRHILTLSQKRIYSVTIFLVLFSCEVSLSLPPAFKPNIRRQSHEPVVRDVPSSLASPHPSFWLTSAVEIVLSILPVPRSGRCPVTKRISHGGESGGARIRIHSFEAHHANFGEDGRQERNNRTSSRSLEIIVNTYKVTSDWIVNIL